MIARLVCGDRTLNLERPRVMGVLNITPDSFSDGGELFSLNSLKKDRILARASQMLSEGADLLDIGGESTRPGAEPVGIQEELDRVLGALSLLKGTCDTIFSIDTSSPMVMEECARLGAGLLNDVRAFTREGALEAAVETGLPLCMMHMSGEPSVMQQRTQYYDVIAEVKDFLEARVHSAISAGVSAAQIVIDPGFGFGKTVSQNYEILRRLNEFSVSGYPLLAGLSRKSMIGAITGRPINERITSSAVLAVIAAQRGAKMLRVHDVAETVDALAVWRATETL